MSPLIFTIRVTGDIHQYTILDILRWRPIQHIKLRDDISKLTVRLNYTISVSSVQNNTV